MQVTWGQKLKRTSKVMIKLYEASLEEDFCVDKEKIEVEELTLGESHLEATGYLIRRISILVTSLVP